jgi:hypothetical protein
MAYKESSIKLPLFYNINESVGENCPNLFSDVMLIQYLLVWRYRNCQPRIARVPKDPIKINGIFNDITADWIWAFELDILFGGYSIEANGRIDCISDKTFFQKSVSKTVYTLAWLNWRVSSEEFEAFAAAPSFVPLGNPPSLRQLPRSNHFVIPAARQSMSVVAGV